MMKVGWRPECRWLGCRVADSICPKAPRRSLRIVVVSGGCPVLESIEAFVIIYSHTSGRPQCGGGLLC